VARACQPGRAITLSKSNALGNTGCVLNLETAGAQILAALPAPQSERMRLLEARDRVLAEAIYAGTDLPLFDNSAMDGYAVRAADLAGASLTQPRRLRWRGRIPAGETAASALWPGTGARLFTGAPLPSGADAVVMQEDVQVEGDAIIFHEEVKAGENVRRQGEDVRKGALLCDVGDVLTPGRLGLLAATGAAEVNVGRAPVVGLIATGSELCEAGTPLVAGQIFESNRGMLAALATRAGAEPKIYPLVADTLEATQAALAQAFRECEIVVTSGGVSVGELDFVKAAFEALGGELQFWKVAIRPGKPFVFGRLGNRFLFGLPGNPVSAFVTFLLLVRPALRHWQGAREVSLPSQSGVLGEAISNPGDRRHFIRVRMEATGKVFLTGKQGSHVLASLAAANGLLDVPPHTVWAAGTNVSVWCGF